MTFATGFRWIPRGIGLDKGSSCFICQNVNQHQSYYANISAFVKSKRVGEEIVAAFRFGAWLNFRASEPNWIQVKVCACKAHEEALVALNSQWFVNEEMIDCYRQSVLANEQRLQVIRMAPLISREEAEKLLNSEVDNGK